MCEFFEGVRNIMIKSDEKEDQYLKRLNEAMLICGKVHSEGDKKTLYVNGLKPTINKVVTQHHESVHHRDFTFESLCHLVKFQDEAYNTRLRHITSNVTT